VPPPVRSTKKSAAFECQYAQLVRTERSRHQDVLLRIVPRESPAALRRAHDRAVPRLAWIEHRQVALGGCPGRAATKAGFAIRTSKSKFRIAVSIAARMTGSVRRAARVAVPAGQHRLRCLAAMRLIGWGCRPEVLHDGDPPPGPGADYLVAACRKVMSPSRSTTTTPLRGDLVLSAADRLAT